MFFSICLRKINQREKRVLKLSLGGESSAWNGNFCSETIRKPSELEQGWRLPRCHLASSQRPDGCYFLMHCICFWIAPYMHSAIPTGACKKRHWWCHDPGAFSESSHFFQWYLRRVTTRFSSDHYQQMCIEIPPTFLEPGNFSEAWASSSVAAVPMIIQISLRAVPVNAHRRLVTEHKVWFIELKSQPQEASMYSKLL